MKNVYVKKDEQWIAYTGSRRAKTQAKRPWHATTLRECGQFIGAALLAVGIVQVWVMIALSVLALVLGGLLAVWLLVDAVLGVVA
jgi:uncharacterized membrane protein YdbT with pleckstrin-like domain